MNEDLRGRAIAAMRSLGRRGRTSRVPAPVRQAVLAWVESARLSGRPWDEVSQAVGLSATTLQRWRREAAGGLPTDTPTAMLPVVLREARSEPAGQGCLTLVTPSGLRVEGLAVAQAAELIARLS
jgi:transposase-like protein